MVPDAAAHKLQETVDEITGYSRRTRKLVRGLILVTVAGVLLVVLTGYLFIRLHDSQVGNCAAGNQVKAQQAQLWETFIAIAAGPHPSAADQAKIARLNKSVDATYAPTDCAARYPFW